jgi:hypothetical protein
MSAFFYIFFISNPAFPVRLPTLHSSTLTAQGRVAQYVITGTEKKLHILRPYCTSSFPARRVTKLKAM